MSEQTISKTDFLLFLDCPLHFWALKHHYEPVILPTPMDEFRMQQGRAVEALALEHLQQWMKGQYPNAALLWQQTYLHGFFLARTDALIHDENEECFDLYEVKSSTNMDKKDLFDVAFQAAVCQHTIPLRNLYLVHLNKNYRRQGNLDLNALFLIEDITAAVADLLPQTNAYMHAARTVLLQEEHANVEHCRKPDACPFPDLCHPNVPEHSIYEISRLHRSKALQLEAMGIRAIQEIPDDFPLSDQQREYVEVVNSGQPRVDPDAIQEELTNLHYPLHFLDYETCNPAVPLFEGYKPNQHIVFQFSLHILPAPDAEAEHHQFLHAELSDPAPKLLEKLSHTIQPQGSILVWNKGFECSRHNELAELHPAYGKFLENINSRIFDLMDIFSHNFYIHPAFHGSASIKKVLPVLVPDLSYEGMEIFQGDEASTAWWQMVNGTFSEEEKENTIAHLMKYCQLDTKALLEIFIRLQSIS